MVQTRATTGRTVLRAETEHLDLVQSNQLSPTKRKRSTQTSVSVATPDPVFSITTNQTMTLGKSPTNVSPNSPQSVIFAHDVATIAPEQSYKDLHIPPHELRPSATLTTGQCFNWRAVTQIDDGGTVSSQLSAWGRHDAIEWVGVIRLKNGDSIVVSIKETEHSTLYKVLFGPEDAAEILYEYFQLHHELKPMYEQWSKVDPIRLSKIAKCIPGVRIIEQDPWECLVSFICSSNNNIPRITKMINAIRKEYGRPLLTIGNETLYSFPSLKILKNLATDHDLRNVCGMGYRSKYILETMNILESLGGEDYLHGLRLINNPVTVQEKLIQFCGVGRKVADCVALFSLRQCNAIPVDTHVWNIARRDYDTDNVLQDAKSMTPKVYKQTGDLFRNLFKERAGWAHSLLFVAELPSFRPVLPPEIIEEMEKFREVEQRRKDAAKEAKNKRAKE